MTKQSPAYSISPPSVGVLQKMAIPCDFVCCRRASISSAIRTSKAALSVVRELPQTLLRLLCMQCFPLSQSLRLQLLSTAYFSLRLFQLDVGCCHVFGGPRSRERDPSVFVMYALLIACMRKMIVFDYI